MSNLIDEANFAMWSNAKQGGRTKPSFVDWLDAVHDYLPMALVQSQIQPDNTIMFRLKERSSPALVVRMDGVLMVTVNATKPDVHSPGYKRLMEGMET
jgi:hypothetical protein